MFSGLNRNFFYSSGDWEVSDQGVSLESSDKAFFLGLQTASFSLYSHTARESKRSPLVSPLPLSMGSSWPRNWTRVSLTAGRFFTIWDTREAQLKYSDYNVMLVSDTQHSDIWRGHDSPLQYSWVGNPMDRGAWQAIVHRVAQSWAWLKWLSMHAYILFFRLFSFIVVF